MAPLNAQMMNDPLRAVNFRSPSPTCGDFHPKRVATGS
jgi:hypothetical protein